MRRTSSRIVHLTVVSLRLREDACSSSVPLQLVDAATRGDATEDGGAVEISCKQKRRREENKDVEASQPNVNRSRLAHPSVQPTWFALECQDSLDPCLFTATEISISVHQPDVISHFSCLGR